MRLRPWPIRVAVIAAGKWWPATLRERLGGRGSGLAQVTWEEDR